MGSLRTLHKKEILPKEDTKTTRAANMCYGYGRGEEDCPESCAVRDECWEVAHNNYLWEETAHLRY